MSMLTGLDSVHIATRYNVGRP